jgi:hypothetical protein
LTVLRKGEPVEGQDQADKDWTEAEVGLVVAGDLDMLPSDLIGRAYSKAAHHSALRPRRAGRSDGSVEFKHQNISAVLVGLGLPPPGQARPLACWHRRWPAGRALSVDVPTGPCYERCGRRGAARQEART